MDGAAFVAFEPRGTNLRVPRIRRSRRVSGARALRTALARSPDAVVVVPAEAADATMGAAAPIRRLLVLGPRVPEAKQLILRSTTRFFLQADPDAAPQAAGRQVPGPGRAKRSTAAEPSRPVPGGLDVVLSDATLRATAAVAGERGSGSPSGSEGTAGVVPAQDLADIIGRRDRILAAVADESTVLLYRGDLDTLLVPLSWFSTRPDGPLPTPSGLAITDGGQTLRLGDYEAATEAILYDFDPAFRRRYKKNLIERDASFGGALRRLRIARGLARSDFAPLSDKEVARIERGDVKKPRGRTLAVLAARLRVKPGEIASW